jgi:hypothetical protein
MGRPLANLIAIVGVLIGWGSLYQAPIYGPPVSWMIMATVAFVCVLMHELGHLVAGLLVGGSIQSILVIPFHLSFRPLRMSMTTRSASGDIGGKVVVTGLSDGGSRYRTAVFVAGGPAANILLSIMALPYAIEKTATPTLLSGVAGAIGAVSFGAGIANLVPHMRKEHASDGMLLLRLANRRQR